MSLSLKPAMKAMLAAGLSAAGSLAMAQTEPDPVPDLDPQAVEILTAATDYLAGQQAFSVNWFVSYDEVIDGREIVTHSRSGHNLLSRQQGFYSYAENGLETREFFFDGQAFQILDVEENAYVMASFSGDFEALIDRAQTEYGVVLPIWTLMSQRSSDELLDQAEAAAYLGLTRLAGRQVHHLALSNYDRDWQVWIADDADNPEIVMLVGTDPYTQGWPQYRAFFSGWDFSPEVSDGAFTFVPDETTERMSWPKVAGGDDPAVPPSTGNE